MANNFSLLLKKELVDNRKPMLLGLAGIWSTYILTGILLGMLRGVGVGAEIFVFLFISSFVITIGASLAFSNMKTKEGRINTLMLPATTFQKFIIRWIATVPLLLLVIAVGCWLGDIARLIIEHLNNYQSVKYESVWMLISENFNKEWGMLASVVIMSILSSQAVYFFGSILWPKLSFIKTLAAMQVVQLLFSIITFSIRWDFFLDPFSAIEQLTVFSYVSGAVICIAFYVLSYYRFRSSEVVYKLF